jgi:hypothetical protein
LAIGIACAAELSPDAVHVRTGAATSEHPGRENGMKLTHDKDFWAGIMFVVFGVFFAIAGIQYEAGTAAEMGAGYFPRLLAITLILIGILCAWPSLSRRPSGPSLARLNGRVVLLVIGPVALFGLLLPLLGMVVSLFALVLASSYASHEFTWRASIVNAVVLVLICVAIFVWSLKLQFPLWPSFIAE